MPIYEFRCQKGHAFEVMRRVSDDPITACEVCGASVQRVFHPIAVHFKGSGFYNTDYGTRKRSREMKESGEGSAGDGAKSTSDAGGAKSDSDSSGGSKSEPGGTKTDSGGSGSKSDSGAKKSESKAKAAG